MTDSTTRPPRTAVEAFDAELAALDGTRGKPRPVWATDRLRRAIVEAEAAAAPDAPGEWDPGEEVAP